jgi:hypothetical protein
VLLHSGGLQRAILVVRGLRSFAGQGRTERRCAARSPDSPTGRLSPAGSKSELPYPVTIVSPMRRVESTTSPDFAPAVRDLRFRIEQGEGPSDRFWCDIAVDWVPHGYCNPVDARRHPRSGRSGAVDPRISWSRSWRSTPLLLEGGASLAHATKTLRLTGARWVYRGGCRVNQTPALRSSSPRAGP